MPSKARRRGEGQTGPVRPVAAPSIGEGPTPPPAAAGEQVPEGERSLEQNEELHRQLQRLARTGAAAEYERENVIGDPHQTFGVEIEFDGADPNAVARALHEAGLAASPYQEGYHSGRR